MVPERLKPHAKAVATLLTAVGTWGATAALEGGITAVEGFGFLVVLGATVTTWLVPNEQPQNIADVLVGHLPSEE